MKTVFVILLVIGITVGGVGYYLAHASTQSTMVLRMAAVQQGDLTSTIGATGTVEPVEVVDVGAQVAGIIKKLESDPRGKTDPAYKDKVIDWTTPVYGPDTEPDPEKRDPDRQTVLARIDDVLYRAAYAQANANLTRAIADERQAEAKQLQAEQEWKRAKKLRPDLDTERPDGAPPVKVDAEFKALSDSDFDLAKANYDAAKATVDSAKATIEQARAALQLAQANLDYTVIKSPVDGVIIDRRVNVGQTVVASLSAPSLFLIAKDLKHMQVWASVNEADIGRIHEGMDARFTVDAHPKDVFRGKVEQLRLNATMTQNVVTYTVIVSCDNADLKLKPYLTANVQFEVESRQNVLQAPNAALRWKPRPEQIAPEFREAAAAEAPEKGRGKGGKAKGGSPGDASSAQAAKGRANPSRGRVWVKDEDEHVRPVDVQIGIIDTATSMTEVSGPDVKDGIEVVVGEAPQSTIDGDTTNPFAPKIFRGNQPKKPQQ